MTQKNPGLGGRSRPLHPPLGLKNCSFYISVLSQSFRNQPRDRERQTGSKQDLLTLDEASLGPVSTAPSEDAVRGCQGVREGICRTLWSADITSLIARIDL